MVGAMVGLRLDTVAPRHCAAYPASAMYALWYEVQGTRYKEYEERDLRYEIRDERCKEMNIIKESRQGNGVGINDMFDVICKKNKRGVGENRGRGEETLVARGGG